LSEGVGNISHFAEQFLTTGEYRRNKQEVTSAFTHVINFKHQHVYKTLQTKQDSLFDNGGQLQSKVRRIKSPELKRWFSAVGKISKGSTHENFFSMTLTTSTHDFYVTNKQDFWRQVAVTTGTKDFAYKNLILRWYNMGWVEIGDGLYKKEQCDYDIVGGKFVFRKRSDIHEFIRPPIWESEQHFFDWLGLNYIEPDRRF
jgi:hypothetical protein